MVVRLKTQGRPIEHFEKKLTGYDATRDIYDILPGEFMEFLKSACVSGNRDFEISLKEEDLEKVRMEENKHHSKKISHMYYLESKLNAQIQELEEDNDIEKFFEKIGFDDKDHIARDLCTYIKENVTKDDMYVRYKGRLYYIVFSWIFGSDAFKRKEILKKQIKLWMELYHRDFIKRFGSTVRYTIFIQIVLKHIGYKY